MATGRRDRHAALKLLLQCMALLLGLIRFSRCGRYKPVHAFRWQPVVLDPVFATLKFVAR